MKNMKKWVALSVLLIVVLTVNSWAFADQSSASGWKLKGISAVENNPKLLHMVWEVARPPYGIYDKIKLHRVVSLEKDSSDKKVILMLPGTWGAGGWSEVTDSNVNSMLYLAASGYDVYMMGFRTANIPNMDYDQLVKAHPDAVATIDWNYAAYREDVKACVEKIKNVSKTSKMFMSGFSRGVSLMLIYANKYQDDLTGMVVFDGLIQKTPPMGPQLDEATYKMLIDWYKAGQLPNPFSGEPLPWVVDVEAPNYDSWKLAGALPNSKKMVGAALPSNFTSVSDLVADEAYQLWGPSVLTNYYGGYIDRDVLIRIVNEFDRFHPCIQTLEDIQMMAWDNVPFFNYDDNEVDLPAIAFMSLVTCPGGVVPSLPNKTKNPDVTIKFMSGYGHMDILFGKNSLTDVKKPLLDWLNSHYEKVKSHQTEPRLNLSSLQNLWDKLLND